jgi:hypothetical protein
MERIPIHDATAPIVRTIGSDEIADRVALIDRLRERLGSVERTEYGLLLRFPSDADVEADLRRFAVDEKRCCGFWGFEVVAAREELALRWDGPPDAAGLLDHLHAYFEGDAELSGISAFL